MIEFEELNIISYPVLEEKNWTEIEERVEWNIVKKQKMH